MSTIATTSDTSTRSTLVLKRSDVVDLLSMAECIDAVEAACEAHARGRARGPEVVSLYVDGGGFHMKAVGLVLSRPYFAAKTNGNFFHNDRLQLPRIQGTIVLCDASNGSPLALLDSIEITTLRTAAATAVAARRLALPDASSLAIIGCGIQGHATWRAIVECFPIDRVYLCDPNREAVNSLFELAERTGATPEITPEPGSAVRAAQICVTCTPATEPIVRRKDVHPGVFLAAVGADSEIKQELDPEILHTSRVIVDNIEQAAAIGEVRHAVDDTHSASDVITASLGDVIAGSAQGRVSEDDVVVFDSTGTALQDVAAAAIVFEKALRTGRGVRIEFGA